MANASIPTGAWVLDRIIDPQHTPNWKNTHASGIISCITYSTYFLYSVQKVSIGKALKRATYLSFVMKTSPGAVYQRITGLSPINTTQKLSRNSLDWFLTPSILLFAAPSGTEDSGSLCAVSMMTIRWSWFFTFPLLVLSSYAQNDDHNANTEASRFVQHVARSLDSSRADNAVAIGLGVTAGVILLVALLVFLLYLRKRKRAMNQIEDGVSEVAEEKPQWWHIDLQSAKGTTWWVLETKGGGKEREGKNSGEEYLIKPKTPHLDRLRRYFLSPKNAVKQDPELPRDTFQHPAFPAPADQTNPIARPLPAIPNSHSRYPTILDRPGNPPGFPPPSPYKNTNLARTIRAVESREKLDRRRVQIPPKALAVPHGRPIPGLPERKAAVPKSPSGHRRRSWLSRQAFKNPFLPLKESDAVLPSSVSAGLALRQQMAHSPRSRSNLSAPATSPPDASRMGVARRIPAPIYEERRTIQSPATRPPGTGGVPKPKYQVDERAMRSALPLGYQSRPPTNARHV
ncbi:hypothetical protein D9756_000819 [Leucocoprinus leucothites]|uniref:Uncharacterized protein n=1 Tax=Leucocoprinus leucothites TaxID=201217 RepID=A0A8H5LMT6_9AGAR|nr:hypothetical protein D9756_000819 [Leucoagaricus leucothites]